MAVGDNERSTAWTWTGCGRSFPDICKSRPAIDPVTGGAVVRPFAAMSALTRPATVVPGAKATPKAEARRAISAIETLPVLTFRSMFGGTVAVLIEPAIDKGVE